jgi:hypothetical protein
MVEVLAFVKPFCANRWYGINGAVPITTPPKPLAASLRDESMLIGVFSPRARVRLKVLIIKDRVDRGVIVFAVAIALRTREFPGWPALLRKRVSRRHAAH